MADTQSLARRIAEKLWDKMLAYKLVPHDPKEAAITDVATRVIQHAWKQHAEQIIAAELAEHDRKVREFIDAAEQYYLDSEAVIKGANAKFREAIRTMEKELTKG